MYAHLAHCNALGLMTFHRKSKRESTTREPAKQKPAKRESAKRESAKQEPEQVSVLAHYPLARQRRGRIYGYKIPAEFLLEYSKNNNLFRPDDDYTSQFDAICEILYKCRINNFNTCRVAGVKLPVYCLCIGHDKTLKGLHMATPRKIERVKRVLGTTEDPEWLIPVN